MNGDSVCAYYEETFYGPPMECEEPTQGESVYCWVHAEQEGPMDDEWLNQEPMGALQSGGYDLGHYKNGLT